MNNISSSIKEIRKLYDPLTFTDHYGNSIILFVFLTIIVLLVHAYYKILINMQPIKDDWANQRCKPNIMPFAGLINKPNDQSMTEFAQNNFTDCIQSVLKQVTGYFISPIQFVTNTLNDMFTEMTDSLQQVRIVLENVRNSMTDVTKEIYGRALNFLIPLQQMIIAFKDSVGKVQGVLVSGLYTAIGSYYTLKSVLGAVVNFILLLLIALVAMIIPLLIFPVTAFLAVPLISLFVLIAVPLAIILVVFADVFHIHPSHTIPSLPSVCFDAETLLDMEDGSKKPICDVVAGDILKNQNMVTAKMKFLRGKTDMYRLHNVVVSGSHYVWHGKKKQWMHVEDHNEAQLIEAYEGEYIYCLNTSSKRVRIDDILFSDWDDLINEDLLAIEDELDKREYKNDRENIHRYFDSGFHESTMVILENGTKREIKDIGSGDSLWGGVKVESLVEMDGMEIEGHYTYTFLLEDKTWEVEAGPTIHFLESLKELKWKRRNSPRRKTLYHLITNTGFFYLDTIPIRMYDYNSLIETLLQKNKNYYLRNMYTNGNNCIGI